jgi:fatty-acyl-CoA synthase
MALIVPDQGLDFTLLRTYLRSLLPEYAHPLFLRVRNELEMTATFKHTKATLTREGYDPGAVDDVIYFYDRQRGQYVRLDNELYERIQSGEVRL